jgi:hypothetical protein
MPRASCAEVLEVEGQDRQVAMFGHRHHGCVREPEAQVSEAGIDLDRSAEESLGQEGDLVLAGREGGEEQARGMCSYARVKELIGLDDHRHRNDKLTAEARHELRGDAVGLVAPIGRGQQRPGVSDDLQRAVTSLLR